jgi:hypothetical protein
MEDHGRELLTLSAGKSPMGAIPPTFKPLATVNPEHYADPKRNETGAPTRCTTLPTDGAGRKTFPMATGLLDYFPDALAAVSHVSWKGNEQHNPGKPLHWDRTKSGDEADTLQRHFSQRGTLDTDGIRHSAKVAWRALSLLQKEIEDEQGQPEAPPETKSLEDELVNLLMPFAGEAGETEGAADVLRRIIDSHTQRVNVVGSHTFTCPQDGAANCCPGDAAAHRMCIRTGRRR